MDFYFCYDMREFTRIPYVPVETGNLKWEIFMKHAQLQLTGQERKF